MQQPFDERRDMIGRRRSRGGGKSIYGRSMIRYFLLFTCVFTVMALSGPASADTSVPHSAMATVCPVAPGDAAPDFSSASCETIRLFDVDPQGRDIWVRVMFSTDAAEIPSARPAGLYVSAKASSAAWLNGVYLGANGAPGPERQSETPGRMDAVFFAPHHAIRIGENELVLRLSSHHGFLHLGHPIHWIGLWDYADPSREILRIYGPSLMTFGAFLIGAIYFGVSLLRGGGTLNNGLLFLLSLIAIAQLGLETSRGLFPYDYPFHDYRLVLLTCGAVAFGLCLLFHMVLRFLDRHRAAALSAGMAATALAVILPGGFDSKTLLGMVTPIGFAAAIAVYAAVRKQPTARAYAAAMIAFIALAIVSLAQFLDVVFFYSVAALLLFLIGQQAVLFAKERTLRIDASDRARRLELALEQARLQDAPERLTLHSSGKSDIIEIAGIVYCKGAGDYAEIVLANGARHLHLAKLHELESDLPQTFLRVHRSYIVNTAHVRSLTREANGVGALTMDNGENVPVSRRILPNVRSALQ
jgi:DNA-binding LytR/AlgR family response regulator